MQVGYVSKRAEVESSFAIGTLLVPGKHAGATRGGAAEEPESPLTQAIFRSRRLTSYATPCHARGATFALGSIYGK